MVASWSFGQRSPGYLTLRYRTPGNIHRKWRARWRWHGRRHVGSMRRDSGVRRGTRETRGRTGDETGREPSDEREESVRFRASDYSSISMTAAAQVLSEAGPPAMPAFRRQADLLLLSTAIIIIFTFSAYTSGRCARGGLGRPPRSAVQVAGCRGLAARCLFSFLGDIRDCPKVGGGPQVGRPTSGRRLIRTRIENREHGHALGDWGWTWGRGWGRTCIITLLLWRASFRGRWPETGDVGLMLCGALDHGRCGRVGDPQGKKAAKGWIGEPPVLHM